MAWTGLALLVCGLVVFTGLREMWQALHEDDFHDVDSDDDDTLYYESQDWE